MKLTLTKFKDGQETTIEIYEGDAGANLMALIDADEHIKKGGWCMLDNGNVAQMIERPVFNRCISC